jgi:hypothetical protein
MSYAPGDPKYIRTPLGVAYTQLGVHEVGGKNRGPRVDEYIRSVELDPDDSHAWCAAFVCWCVRGAGKSIKTSGRVARLWELNEDLAVLEPKPSDIAIHLNDDGTGHCGIVDSVTDTHIQCIEGNTNAEGSREGDRVAYKSRLRIYWHAYLRPRGM